MQEEKVENKQKQNLYLLFNFDFLNFPSNSYREPILFGDKRKSW